MIEQITIKNFKSFKDVTLKLGPLNIFIGTNASGKSNFFDALRVLQGIGYGFTLSEILDSKPKSAASEVWKGIRGGSARAAFEFEDTDQPTFFQVAGRPSDNANSSFEFTIAFSAKEGRLREERLTLPGDTIYDSSPERNNGLSQEFKVRYYDHGDKQGIPVTLDANRPVLKQIGFREDWTLDEARIQSLERVIGPQNRTRLMTGPFRSEMTIWAASILADMQRIDPLLRELRDYSQAHEVQRMGERGEHFAALIRMICSDPGTKAAYLSWLRELRPRDVDDIDTREGAVGDLMVVMKERGREWPAPVLSDGTLRFAALAAAFFQPDMPGILTIEEIENGIHASRLRLLVELMRSQTAAGKTQVMVTTHSPVVLAWLKPEEYATTFYCKRDEETGESRIIPLAEIPQFKEIVSKQSISDLFSEGWLEEAL
jgi:predicted ATPase